MQEIPSTIIIEGYASVFHSPDQQGDVMLPGAFQNINQVDMDIPLLWQHYPQAPIGSVVAAKEDQYGLRVTLVLCLETQVGREAFKLIENGVLNGLSIGFKALKAKRGPSAEVRRILQSVMLKEVSIVTFPAHDKARIHFNKKTIDSL